MALWRSRRSVDEEGWFLAKDCAIAKPTTPPPITAWVKSALRRAVLENSLLKAYDVVGGDVNSVGEAEDSDKALIRGRKGALRTGISFYVRAPSRVSKA